jgi:Mlc titration factor MtfA (ptsG expression regulator)
MVGKIIFWLLFGSFVILIVGSPVLAFLQIIYAIVKYFLSDWFNMWLPFTRIDDDRADFLYKHFDYYRRLPVKHKIPFEKRVQKFINLKTFEGRQGLEVTRDMETLVAAAAIQVTFGYPSIYLRRFHTIILYPEAYLSTITGNYHRGEVISGGVIVLSWNNLADGYLNQNDGRNLGLHEMAHAVKLADAYPGEDNDFFERGLLLRFTSLGREEMKLISDGHPSFFRSYAATNDQEFFAVAVENFFERPAEFYEAHLELYNSLAMLLRQDARLMYNEGASKEFSVV